MVVELNVVQFRENSSRVNKNLREYSFI